MGFALGGLTGLAMRRLLFSGAMILLDSAAVLSTPYFLAMRCTCLGVIVCALAMCSVVYWPEIYKLTMPLCLSSIDLLADGIRLLMPYTIA